MRAKRKSRVGRTFATLLIVPISASAWTLVNGCGNDSFTSNDSDAATDATSDVASGDAGASDTFVPPAADAGACDLTAKFQAPVPLSLNLPGEFDQTARLTPDELVIYFQVSNDAGPTVMFIDGGTQQPDAGALQIFTSQRMKITDAWGTRSLLTPIVNGIGRVSDPSVTGDNLQLYFSTSIATDAGTAIAIYTATRISGASAFSGAASVTFDGAAFASTTQPYVLPNGLTLYFRGVPMSGTKNAIFRATRGSTGSLFEVDSPTSDLLTTVNDTDGVSLPVVSADELTIYFTSGVDGARKVSTATRTAVDQPFGTVTDVTELDNYSVDEGSWLSDDGCRLYLSSNLDGNTHLYVATKPPK